MFWRRATSWRRHPCTTRVSRTSCSQLPRSRPCPIGPRPPLPRGGPLRRPCPTPKEGPSVTAPETGGQPGDGRPALGWRERVDPADGGPLAPDQALGVGRMFGQQRPVPVAGGHDNGLAVAVGLEAPDGDQDGLHRRGRPAAPAPRRKGQALPPAAALHRRTEPGVVEAGQGLLQGRVTHAGGVGGVGVRSGGEAFRAAADVRRQRRVDVRIARPAPAGVVPVGSGGGIHRPCGVSGPPAARRFCGLFTPLLPHRRSLRCRVRIHPAPSVQDECDDNSMVSITMNSQ